MMRLIPPMLVPLHRAGIETEFKTYLHIIHTQNYEFLCTVFRSLGAFIFQLF